MSVPVTVSDLLEGLPDVAADIKTEILVRYCVLYMCLSKRRDGERQGEISALKNEKIKIKYHKYAHFMCFACSPLESLLLCTCPATCSISGIQKLRMNQRTHRARGCARKSTFSRNADLRASFSRQRAAGRPILPLLYAS